MTAVHLDETFRESKSQPGAFRLASILRRNLSELLKDEVMILWRNANAIVDHSNKQFAVYLLGS